MTKNQQSLRTMSLEGLKVLRTGVSAPEYGRLIKQSLKGREMTNLRERLLFGKIADNSREVMFQEDLLSFIKGDIEQARGTAGECKDLMSKKEAERQEAYEAFLKAKSNLEKAEQELKDAETALKKAQADQEALEESARLAEKRKDNIDTVVLLHRSASLGQLMDYSLSKIVVTEADADFLKGLITADEVFDGSLAEGLIENLPYEFQDLAEETTNSVVKFVEMAMYYYLMEEKQVVILYANNGIATILKKEGVKE